MKKFIASLVVVFMLGNQVLPFVSSEASANEPVQQKENVKAVQKEVELQDERTATSQVFKQKDGAYRLEISPEPIHVKNKETKKWEKIDNTIVKGKNGRYHNKKSQFDASFSSSTAQPNEPLVAIEKEGKKISIRGLRKNAQPAKQVAAHVTDNTVEYNEIYPKTDINYTIGNSSLKEDIILHEKPTSNDPLEYVFEFDVTGLTFEKTEDGELFFVDSSTREKLFTIEKPVMMDSYLPEGFASRLDNPMPEGSVSDQIHMEVTQTGTTVQITLKPDMEWITAAERTYPVIIDPTVKVFQPKNDLHDTTIRSALPDQTGGADLELGAGLHSTSGNTVRSLLKFDVGQLPAGSKIMNAQLNMRLSSVWNDTASSIGLYEVNSPWEENRATWQRRTLAALWTAKGGDISPALLSSQTIGALDTTASEPQLFKWAISPEIVQNWMANPSSNLGVMLKATNEKTATYKKFYSGDYSGKLQYSPKLTITYYPVSRLGLESYWSYTEHDLSEGLGYVNLGTGNLVLDFTDFAISGRGNSGFEFARTYNSKAVEDSPVGYGWSFTGSETVSEFPNRDVVYQDSDGTTHHFTYNAVTGAYLAPPGTYLTLTKANADAFVLTDFNGNRVVYRDLIKDPEVQSRIYRIDYAEDRNKNKVTYTRSADGRLTGITDATGRTLTLNYAGGRIESGVFGGVKKFAFTYSPDGRLKSSTLFEDGITGLTTTYNYNTNQELTGIVDSKSQLTQYEYDAGFLRRVIQPAIAPKASSTTYTYDTRNFSASEFNANGAETKYALTNQYSIHSITDPSGATSSFVYDNNYNVTNEFAPNRSETINEYDSKGNLIKTTDALKASTTYTYNNFSQPLTVTDTDGTTTFQYNQYGDVIAETNPLGETTTYTYYEPYGNLKSMTPPGGVPETYEYDAMQNYQTKFADALGRKTSIVNDKYGNTTEVTDPKGNKVSYEYNELEQLKSMTDENGNQTFYTYDKNGNLKTILNPRKFQTVFDYNAQNQLVSREEPLHGKSIYTYDALGNIETETMPSGSVLKNEYNANDQLTKIRINNYLKWMYTYDVNGNVSTITNGETNAVASFTYDTTDKLKSITSGAQKIEYGYSPTETLTDIKGTSKTVSFTQRFAFDAGDQLKSMYRNGGIMGAYDYLPTGEPQQRRYVNGVHTTYTYDANQQMDSLKVTKGTSVLLEEKIGYDVLGLLQTVTSTTGNKTFSYDKGNQ
ncbi:DNRLRE domain-containing protein, partial [Sporosarcina sp. NCCP-2716]|uniref:DNRLRE domain-containing protein n=1 Tax=Sporosarcina sp. NCCP-2716 TaxID=2943679 RepID=UPI00203F75F2